MSTMLHDGESMLKKIGFALLCTTVTTRAFAQDTTWFTEASDVGLTGMNGFRIAALDINADDYPDLVLWNDHSATDNESISLLLNSPDPMGGGRKFVDITAQSGINANAQGSGADGGPLSGRMSHLFSMADVNNDGAPDLVSCITWYRFTTFQDRGDRCELLLNDGKGKFTVKEGAGLRELGAFPATGFSFLDYDLDGNIDLFIGTFLQNYDTNTGRSDILLHGNGDGTFTNASMQSGITMFSGLQPKYGTNMVDINNDGWPDIATSPYCRSNGNLWINQQDGTFKDMASTYGYQVSHGLYRQDSPVPILCQWAANPWDYDNDGDMDLVQLLVHGGWDTTMGRTFVARNGGPDDAFKLEANRDLIVRNPPRPDHLGDYYGVWFDMDNSGWVDLAITQGTYTPGQDRLYMTLQDDNHVMQDVTDKLGMLNILSPHAFVTFDYDLDGDEDFALSRQQDAMRIQFFRNDVGNKKHWVTVKLDPPPGVNKSAIGARVVVKTAAFTQTRDVYAGEGNFVGLRPFALLFGLGDQTTIDSITVTWPNKDHTQTVIKSPSIDQRITISATSSAGDAGADAGAPSGSGSSSCHCSSATTNETRPFALLLAGAVALFARLALRRKRSTGPEVRTRSCRSTYQMASGVAENILDTGADVFAEVRREADDGTALSEKPITCLSANPTKLFSRPPCELSYFQRGASHVAITSSMK